MDLAWHDMSGAIGVLLVVLSYFLLQLGRLPSTGLTYSLANAGGASLILLSLAFEFNLSAFLMEAAWLVISLYGIGKYLRRHRKRPTRAGQPGE